MDEFNILFVHYPQHRVIVCKQCRYAVVPWQAARHIKDHHQFISCTTRASIISILCDLTDVAHTLREIRYLEPGQPPLLYLPVYTDGYQCSFRSCRYICQTLRAMKRHCRSAHLWVNRRKQGRQLRGLNIEDEERSVWRSGVTFQRFFEYAQWRSYFEVRPAGPIAAEGSLGSQVLAQLHEEASRRRVPPTTINTSTRFETNPWVEFTGWERHLSGFEKDSLLATLQPVPQGAEVPSDDIGLQRACSATKAIIRKALTACNIEQVGAATLHYVNRRETGEQSNEKPFQGRYKVTTVRKYSDTWLKLLRYIWRTSSWATHARPRYSLTAAQHACLTRLRAASASTISSREDLESICLHFWISIFNHELTSSEYDNVALSGVAVLGFDTTNKTWASAQAFTPRLSAIITILKALVVYSAYLMRESDIEELQSQGHSLSSAQEQARRIYTMVKTSVETFMTLTSFGGQPSPIDRILHMRTFGMKIRFNTKDRGRISWKGDSIYIDKVTFSIGDIRSLIHGVYESARTILLQDVLFFTSAEVALPVQSELPELDLVGLVDNPVEFSSYWSFLEDARNTTLVGGKRWLWLRMQHNNNMRKAFLANSSIEEIHCLEDIRWNHTGIEKWFRKVKAFKELLLVLVHLSAGAPARGSELITLLHENHEMGTSQRGIFIDRGLIQLVTSYHKGYSISQQQKIIHRFLPAEVSELIVRYLWLVEPFLQLVLQEAFSREDRSSFLWEPEPEDKFEDNYDGYESSIASRESDTESNSSSTSSIVGQQRAEARNVDGFWSGERVSRVLGRESLNRIGTRITTSIWRQAYPAMQREWSQSKDIHSILEQLYTTGRKTVEDETFDTRERQSGHTKRTEQMIYGVEVTESPYYTISERDAFRKVSIDWHQFLHFESAWEAQPGAQASRARIRESQREQEIARWKRIRQYNMIGQLRKLAGIRAELHGVQLASLNAIMARQLRILTIMRTGGGKSMLFMLPASCSVDGVTIVIVPLLSLREDMRRRCEKAGIICAVWNGSIPPYQASIILITPEAAVSVAFHRFISEKLTMRQLDRIVIDECHTILNSSDKWRPEVLRLLELVEKETQVIFLTATLPPSLEVQFFVAMRLRKEEVTIFRDTTIRSNIAYRVKDFDVEHLDHEVKSLVEALQTKYPLPGQILIYCKTITIVQRLACVLSCSAYYSTIGSEKQKELILQKLLDGREHVLVATNALGLGIDIPTIRAVVHVGMQTKIIEYAQESGRAGRDGLPSEAIIMRAIKIDNFRRPKVVRTYQQDRGMKDFMSGTCCRRIALDREMDGHTDRTICMNIELHCDICAASMQGSSSLVDKVIQQRVIPTTNPIATMELELAREVTQLPYEEEAQRLEEEQRAYNFTKWKRQQQSIEQYSSIQELESLLDSWIGQCVICRYIGKENTNHVGLDSCSEISSSAAEASRLLTILENVVIERYAGCSFCRVPQGVCNSWESHTTRSWGFSRRRGGACQYKKEFLSAACASILKVSQNEDIWLEMENSTGLSAMVLNSRHDFMQWLGKRLVYGGIEMSGMCRLLLFTR